MVAVGAPPSSLRSICVAPAAPAVRTPAGKVMLVMPIVAGLSVKVFVPGFHTHVFNATGFAPIFKLIALVAQFDVAFVVKPPIFTVICAFGVKAVVQVRVTAGLLPDPRIEGDVVELVAARAG